MRMSTVLSLLAIVFVLAPSSAAAAGAVDATTLANLPPAAAIGNLINIFLAILGIIAMVMMIYGSFLWMTASANVEQIDTAQTLLLQGFIGFVIIALTWSIATYVVAKIGGAT